MLQNVFMSMAAVKSSQMTTAGKSHSTASVAGGAAGREPSSQESVQEQGVITLTSRNFDSSIRDGNTWLVEFYSPWCGHCKRFAPTYESIAMEFHSSDSPIKVAKIDGTIERALTSRFSIKGYPTFFLIKGWDVFEFTAPRSKENMMNFALLKMEGMEPMNFLVSPFGPLGMTRGIIINTGTWIIDVFELLIEKGGLGQTLTAVIMSGIATLVGTVLIICIGLCLVPKAKVD